MAIIIGVVRYSTFEPGSNAWRASKMAQEGGVEKYLDWLYSADRMDVRSSIFLDYSLPQLELARKGHDLVLVVRVSKELPSKYRDQLEDAANIYPFLRVSQLGDDDSQSNDGMDRIARSIAGKSNPIYAAFRLDDDDLLSARYCNELARHVTVDCVGYGVSFGRGFTGHYDSGQFRDLRVYNHRMFSAGLATICRASSADGTTPEGIHPALGSHSSADSRVPVVSDCRRPMFLRSFHDSNDSELTDLSAKNSLEMINDRLAGQLPISVDDPSLVEDFPSVAAESKRRLIYTLTDVGVEGGGSFEWTAPAGISVSEMVFGLSSSANGKAVFVPRFTDPNIDMEHTGKNLGLRNSPVFGWWRYFLHGPQPALQRFRCDHLGLRLAGFRLVSYQNAPFRVRLFEALS